jgi:hypothetical protein
MPAPVTRPDIKEVTDVKPYFGYLHTQAYVAISDLG